MTAKGVIYYYTPVWNRHNESSCGSLVVRGSLTKVENIKREVIVEEE
jgi:hypothetical protein